MPFVWNRRTDFINGLPHARASVRVIIISKDIKESGRRLFHHLAELSAGLLANTGCAEGEAANVSRPAADASSKHND